MTMKEIYSAAKDAGFKGSFKQFDSIVNKSYEAYKRNYTAWQDKGYFMENRLTKKELSELYMNSIWAKRTQNFAREMAKASRSISFTEAKRYLSEIQAIEGKKLKGNSKKREELRNAYYNEFKKQTVKDIIGMTGKQREMEAKNRMERLGYRDDGRKIRIKGKEYDEWYYTFRAIYG